VLTARVLDFYTRQRRVHVRYLYHCREHTVIQSDCKYRRGRWSYSIAVSRTIRNRYFNIFDLYRTRARDAADEIQLYRLRVRYH